MCPSSLVYSEKWKVQNGKMKSTFFVHLRRRFQSEFWGQNLKIKKYVFERKSSKVAQVEIDNLCDFSAYKTIRRSVRALRFLPPTRVFAYSQCLFRRCEHCQCWALWSAEVGLSDGWWGRDDRGLQVTQDLHRSFADKQTWRVFHRLSETERDLDMGLDYFLLLSLRERGRSSCCCAFHDWCFLSVAATFQDRLVSYWQGFVHSSPTTLCLLHDTLQSDIRLAWIVQAPISVSCKLCRDSRCGIARL